MTPQEIFLTRLRRQRRHARVEVGEIAAHLKIRPELIEAFENNDLSGWPRGLHSREWVRGYAETVELDPVDTVDEFCRLFPQGDRRLGSTIRDMAALANAESGYQDEFQGPKRRSTDPVPDEDTKADWVGDAEKLGRSVWTRLTAPQLRVRRRPRTEP